MHSNRNDKMNILLATDTNFVMPLTVCLTSLFENNKHRKIDVYILHSPLLEDQKNKMLGLAKSYGQTIQLKLVNEHYFNDVPVFFKWSKEAYYRLLINEYLPKELDRILYLDCDTIVNKPIDDLYYMDLGDRYLAMNEDTNIEKYDYRSALGLNSNGSYFNSGVILFDLTKCRDLMNYKKICGVIEEIRDGLKFVDQDVINVIFDEKVTPLDLRYNNYYVTMFKNHRLDRLFNNEDKEMMEETYIFHFTEKPWSNLYDGSCEDVWYKYLKISPFKDLYFNKFNRIKYKILRTGVMKSLINEYLRISPLINKTATKLLSKNMNKKLKDFYKKNIR